MSVALVLSGSLSALAAERYEDAVGDALGDAPDVVAVTVDEPEGPVLRFSGAIFRETLYTEEVDHFPEVDQPPAHYPLAPGQD